MKRFRIAGQIFDNFYYRIEFMRSHVLVFLDFYQSYIQSF